MKTLRALAALLSYPSADLIAATGEIRQAIDSDAVVPPAERAALHRLIDDLAGGDLYDLQERYGLLFDRTRSLSLHLFEHVHGESRDRGQAMVDLLKLYEESGYTPTATELPDFLPVLLEFASTQPPQQARDFLGETAHIVRAIFSALLKRQSPYASVLAAVLELAGEKAEAVAVPDEPAMDESWAEPAVFGGCSTEGQAKPGQPQAIQIVRKSPPISQGAQA